MRFGFKFPVFLTGLLLIVSMSGAEARGFAALAIGTGGVWGYARNFDTVDEAQDRAIAECRKHGRGCQIFRVFQDTCVSVARNEDPKNVIIRWVYGGSSEQRRRQSLRDCRDEGGDNCKILTEFCTGRAE